MPSVSVLRENPVVDFFRTYGPIPAANSIWDEHVRAESERTGVKPIEVKSERLADLLANFRSDNPVSVILSGTAGDGKTWHCRRLFVELGGDQAAWDDSGPMIEMALGSRRLIFIKDLSQFHGQPELPGIMARMLPALFGKNDSEVFLVAANDGQLLRFWRMFAEENSEARRVEEKIRVLLKEERTVDPELRMQLHNLSRQPHDEVFDNVVEALATHPGWQDCSGCALYNNDSCPIRRNLAVLANPADPGMRVRLRSLIRLAAYNDNHLPIRHILMLAVNVILGVANHSTPVMRCSTAHSMAESGDFKDSNPYDNALGHNLPDGSKGQYRAFTVFDDMGIGRETNNTVDSILVDAEPAARYDAIMRADPVFGSDIFDHLRSLYQRGQLDNFEEFQAGIERQRRRMFFTLPRGDKDPFLDPWRLTIFSHGGDYLDFVNALTANRMVDALRARLVTGLNRSYTGTMCDENQTVWFASPAANTQSRIGRVLDIDVPVGPRRRDSLFFEFQCDPQKAYGRPEMAVREKDGGVIASNTMTPLLFEYLLRVSDGSLPGSFSRQCFEELRQYRMRVIAYLSHHNKVDLNDIRDLHTISENSEGKLVANTIGIIGMEAT